MRCPLLCLLVGWWLADLAGLSWLDQCPAVRPAEHGSLCTLGSSLLHVDSCWGPGWRARSSSHDNGKDTRGKAQLHKHLSQSCQHLMVKAHHRANIKGEEVGSVSSNRNCTLTWQGVWIQRRVKNWGHSSIYSISPNSFLLISLRVTRFWLK